MRTLRALGLAVVLLCAILVLEGLLRSGTGGTRLLDPFLLVTVWFGMHGRRSEGVLVGAVAGFVQDCLGSVVFGSSLLAKVFVGQAAKVAARRLAPGELVAHAVLVGGAVLVEALVLAAAGYVLGRDLDGRSALQVVLAVLVNAAAGVVVFGAVGAVQRRRGKGSHVLREA